MELPIGSVLTGIIIGICGGWALYIGKKYTKLIIKPIENRLPRKKWLVIIPVNILIDLFILTLLLAIPLLLLYW